MTLAYLLTSCPLLWALARWHSSACHALHDLPGRTSPPSNPHLLYRKDTVTASRNLTSVPDLIEPGASTPVERT